jgi:hypothetical protein
MTKFIVVSIGVMLGMLNQAMAKGITTTSSNLYFIENKGQVVDQFVHARKDIQFVLHGNGVTMYIGNGQLHYQFTRVTNDCLKPDNNLSFEKIIAPPGSAGHNMGYEQVPAKEFTSYRLDVELVGANTNAQVIAEQMLP